jgi:hypothetical protein
VIPIATSLLIDDINIAAPRSHFYRGDIQSMRSEERKAASGFRHSDRDQSAMGKKMKKSDAMEKESAIGYFGGGRMASPARSLAPSSAPSPSSQVTSYSEIQQNRSHDRKERASSIASDNEEDGDEGSRLVSRREQKDNDGSSPHAGISSSEAPAPADMTRIITKQQASGAWVLDDVISSLKEGRVASKGLTVEKIRAALPAEGSSIADASTLWTTAIVVAVLKTAYGEHKAAWELVVEKAERFVAGAAPGSFDWLAAASAWLASL